MHHCYDSLYTDRAKKYRNDMGFTGINVAISVGVRKWCEAIKRHLGLP